MASPPVRECVECGAEYERKGGQLTCGIACALARRARMDKENLEWRKQRRATATAARSAAAVVMAPDARPSPDARLVGNRQLWPTTVWGRSCKKCGGRFWKITADDEASCVQCGLVLYRGDCEAVPMRESDGT